MFSGIIEETGRVTTLSHSGQSLVLSVKTGFRDLASGQSIAINGVCLTVTKISQDGTVAFFVSPETIQRSNMGSLAVGNLVNLERAVRLDTRLSGHLVQGHVDGMAILCSLTPQSDARRLEFQLPEIMGRYCIEKGSIALNGVSLTLNKVTPQPDKNFLIELTIIPLTWKHTNLHTLQIGAAVNVEIDVIAKYVESLCQPYLNP